MDNYSYDSELRKLGYVDSGYSGSRGDYFILSYRPGARRRHKLKEGLVEVNVCRRANIFRIVTPEGSFYTLDDAIKALTVK